MTPEPLLLIASWETENAKHDGKTSNNYVGYMGGYYRNQFLHSLSGLCTGLVQEFCGAT